MNIALVASYYYPQQIVGAQRPSSLAKTWAKAGHTVVVYTIGGAFAQDKETVVTVSSMTQRKWRPTALGFIMSVTLRLLWRIGAAQRDRLWVSGVKRRLWRDHKRSAFDFIYVTYPESDALLVGAWARQALHVPLVTEFRDGLHTEPLYKRRGSARLTALRLERNSMADSNVVVSISLTLTRKLVARYGRRVEYVPNGYTGSCRRFIEIERRRSDVQKPVRVFHVGRLSGSRPRNIDSLIAGLMKHALQSQHQPTVHFVFIGELLPTEKRRIIDTGVRVAFEKPIPYAELSEYLHRNADAYLLYGSPELNSLMTTKLFDYMRVPRPVIAMVGTNDSGEAIRETGIGEVIDFDGDALAVALRRLREGDFHFRPNYERIARYNRSTQAREILTVLERTFAS